MLGLAWIVLGVQGCGPEPVGVDDCRQIESARCDAGAACGFVEDAEACRRFYRDQCLHGLATDTAPAGQDVEECVEAIQRAGSCAKEDADQSIDDCVDRDSEIDVIDRDLETVCDVVRHPEGIRQCEFLDPELGAAGAAGAADD